MTAFAAVIQQDINKIVLDLREAHIDDFFSIPEDNPLEDFLQTAEETAREDSDPEQKQRPLSIDDVTAMIAGQIGQLAPMDEETSDLFQKLLKKVMEQKND